MLFMQLSGVARSWPKPVPIQKGYNRLGFSRTMALGSVRRAAVLGVFGNGVLPWIHRGLFAWEAAIRPDLPPAVPDVIDWKYDFRNGRADWPSVECHLLYHNPKQAFTDRWSHPVALGVDLRLRCSSSPRGVVPALSRPPMDRREAHQSASFQARWCLLGCSSTWWQTGSAGAAGKAVWWPVARVGQDVNPKWPWRCRSWFQNQVPSPD